MRIDDLSVSIEHLPRKLLLADWHWLLGTENLPVLVTKAGDVFTQNVGTNQIMFLDVVQGSASVVAKGSDELHSLLKNVEFVAHHFALNLVAPLIKSGPPLPEGSLYGWKRLPVLGGEYSTENLEPTDIEVHFSVAGQLWRQVKDLPDGTKIGDVVTV